MNGMQIQSCFRLLTLAVLWLWSLLVTAQDKPTRPYALGDGISNFALRNVDETTVRLDDYAGKAGLVVVFLSNHCPFSVAYEDRLLSLNRQLAPRGFAVLAIMSDDPAVYDTDSFANMKARARAKNYSFPYLLDETQAVARQFGATRTPQAFVLQRAGTTFRLAYSGAIDDSPQDAAAVQHRYVEAAITDLLAGRPVATPIVKPIGCVLTLK
jgi:peroxiredoxin